MFSKFFKNADMVFDIESEKNIFLLAQFFPIKDIVIFTLIDDDNLYVDNEETRLKLEKSINNSFNQLKNTKVYVEVLKDEIDMPKTKYANGIPYGNITEFIKRIGAVNVLNDINKYSLKTKSIILSNTKDKSILESIKEPLSLYNKRFSTTNNLLRQIDDVRTSTKSVEFKEEYLNTIFTKFLPTTDAQSSSKLKNYYSDYFYPKKVTDYGYDENTDGLRIGFNSTEYDLTMLAMILASTNALWVNYQLNKDALQKNNRIADYLNCTHILETQNLPSAESIREFNDAIFKHNKAHDKRMSDFITRFSKPESYNSNELRDTGSRYLNASNFTNVELQRYKHAAMQYDSLRATRRYIDIKPLAEKLQNCSQKRISGYLGLNIREFEGLGKSEKIKDLDQLLGLMTYCMVDVLNCAIIYTQPTYQTPLIVRNEWLEKWDSLTYAKDIHDKTNSHALKSALNLKTNWANKYDGATLETTSAKFIANSIAPYRAFNDLPEIDFIFPDKRIFDTLSPEQRCGRDDVFDILEDTRQWAYDNLPDKGDCFEPIYEQYKRLVHRSNNRFTQRYEDDALVVKCLRNDEPIPENIKAHYADESHMPTKDMLDLFDEEGHLDLSLKNIETVVNYINADGSSSPYIATISVGGLHSSEFDLDKIQEMNDVYHESLQKYYDKQAKAQENERRIQILINQGITPAQANEMNDATIEDDVTGELFSPKSCIKRVTKKNTEPSWRVVKAPTRLPVKPDIKKAGYVSTGKHYHADFESYYPTLCILLGIFYDDVLQRDQMSETKALRVKHKAQAGELSHRLNTEDFDDKQRAELEQELDTINRRQLSEKLYLNSGTGGADVKTKGNYRSSNIIMNNKILKMRIIGQLITWRVSQMLVLNGIGVTSGNTDGLYAYASVPFEEFSKLVKDAIKGLFINIDPEIVDNFVSKDTNNRLEMVNGHIVSASGGMLKTYKGPEKLNNAVDHPALYDRILVEYLARHKDPANNMFDMQLGQEIIADIKKLPQDTILNLAQWILQSGEATHRYIYENIYSNSLDKSGNFNYKADSYDINERVKDTIKTNRVFLIKRPTDESAQVRTLNLATKQKVELKKRKERAANGERMIQHNAIARHIITAHNDADLIDNFEHEFKECVIQKVKDMPVKRISSLYNPDLDEPLSDNVLHSTGSSNFSNQPILIENRAFSDLTTQRKTEIIEQLDFTAYLEVAVGKFYSSWCNIKTLNKYKEQIEEQLNQFENLI